MLNKILIIASLFFLSSCAAIFNKKEVDLSINSNPSGAQIIIGGANYGTTPATFKITPDKYTVTLVKQGYGSTDIRLETWQSLRRNTGEQVSCFMDAMGSLLIFPFISFSSVYCRDFKPSEYSVSIPANGSGSAYTPTSGTSNRYYMRTGS